MAESKEIEDGGAAFPRTVQRWNDSLEVAARGMTLRDWFAGQAIGAVIRQCAADLSFREDTSPAEYFARKSFEIADALIAARGAK